MQSGKKYNIAFFYKISEGELHVALPLLKAIKESNSDVSIYFMFNDKAAYEGIGEISKLIINELGSLIVGDKNFYSYLLKNFKRETLIMTCDSGLRKWSKLAGKVISKNKLILHAQAYALHGYFKLEEYYSKVKKYPIEKDFFKHLGDARPLLVLNSRYDASFYAKLGVRAEERLLAGAFGYTKWWSDYLLEISKSSRDFKSIVSLLENKKYESVIFVPTRRADRNKVLLTEENYNYLIESIFWLADNNPGFLFLLKPHPRERALDYLKEKCNTSKHGNIVLVKENIILLSKFADLTVAFWGSAIQDSLSVGTPVIEFHRHEVEHFNLERADDGSLVSLYHYLGFCPYITTKEELQDFLSNKQEWSEIQESSVLNFQKIFSIDDKTKNEFIERINNIFLELESLPVNAIRSVFTINYYFLKNSLKRIYKIFFKYKN